MLEEGYEVASQAWQGNVLTVTYRLITPVPRGSQRPSEPEAAPPKPKATAKSWAKVFVAGVLTVVGVLAVVIVASNVGSSVRQGQQGLDSIIDGAVGQPAAGVQRQSAAAFVSDACNGTSYRRCEQSLTTALDVFAGSYVAICEYADGEGDIVLLDSPDVAEEECSGYGLISPSDVADVVLLP